MLQQREGDLEIARTCLNVDMADEGCVVVARECGWKRGKRAQAGRGAVEEDRKRRARVRETLKDVRESILSVT